MTFLLERLGNYDLDLVQYWDKRAGDYSTILVNRKTGDERAYAFKHFNAETDPFPYPDEAFDVIVNCDTIEHLLCNPVHMLVESHRILKPGGVMVVSTPNVLRLSNLCRLLRGQNIYDKYCQESAYARHPREYTPEEIRLLFKAVGFEVAHLETRDLTPQTEGRRARLFAALLVRFLERVASLRNGWAAVPLSWRGEQIFLVARRAGAARRAAPEFLFEAPTLARQTIEAICRPTETVGS